MYSILADAQARWREGYSLPSRSCSPLQQPCMLPHTVQYAILQSCGFSAKCRLLPRQGYIPLLPSRVLPKMLVPESLNLLQPALQPRPQLLKRFAAFPGPSPGVEGLDILPAEV